MQLKSYKANWLAVLGSSSSKSSLVEFLDLAWSNSDNASLFEGKFFANCGSICYKFMSVLDKVVRTKERLRFISVGSIYSNLGKNLWKTLPAYHPFTVSDITAAFSEKRKI